MILGRIANKAFNGIARNCRAPRELFVMPKVIDKTIKLYYSIN